MNPRGLEYPCTGSHHFILLYPPPPGRRYLLLHGKIWRARATNNTKLIKFQKCVPNRRFCTFRGDGDAVFCFGHWLCKVLGRFFLFCLFFLHLLEESMEETWVSSFQTCLGEVSSACDMKTTTLLHLQFTWKEEALWDIKQIDSRPYLDGCFILLCVGPWLFMHACVDLGT